jgi:hypothetical protein
VTAAVTLLVVTLTGISGVHYDATPAQVAARWHTPVRFVWTGEHPGLGTAPICRRGLVGAGVFGGTGDGAYLSLRSAWFVRGARTDRGVGIGTPVAELRAAYGTRLVATTRAIAYGPAGTDRAFMVTSAAPPRTAIVFGLVRNRVRLLGWGLLQALGAEAFAAPDGIRC